MMSNNDEIVPTVGRGSHNYRNHQPDAMASNVNEYVLNNYRIIPTNGVYSAPNNVIDGGNVVIASQILGPVTISYSNSNARSNVDTKPNPICVDSEYPDQFFTGRSHELSLLKDATINHQNRPGNKPPIVVVSGLGGVGKTQLARKFIHDNHSSYNNVIWINSQDHSSILAAFEILAKQYLGISTQLNMGNFKPLIGEIFNKLTTSTTIIVFDNLDKVDNNEIIRIVLTLRTPGIRPHVVITSRIQEWSSCVHFIKLDAWNVTDAVEYISTKLDDSNNLQNESIEDKMALVEKLQYFPLALAQAVAHIEYHGYCIKDYIRDYNSSSEEILGSTHFQKDVFNSYEQTTLTTWNVTIAAINRCKASGDLALRIHQIISYFDPNRIRRDIFYNLSPDIGKKVELAVKLLVNYSMVDSYNSQNVLSVHRLVQQVTRIELERNLVSKKQILRDGLYLISKMELHEEFEECVEHGISVFQEALPCKELVHEYKTFPTTILRKLRLYGKYIRALNFALKIFGDFTFVLEENDPVALKYLCDTAALHISLGKYSKALEMHQIVYEKRKTVLGESHTNTLVSMSNIAISYNYLGKHSEALAMHQAVFEKQVAVLGENHLDTLASMSNIAICYNGLGKHFEALKMHQTVFEKRITVLGENHPHILVDMSLIENSYNCMGKHSEALEIQREVFDIQKVESKQNHRVSMSNIPISYNGLSKHSDALETHQAVFERQTSVSENHLPHILDSMSRIAISYNCLNKHSEALEMQKAVFEKQKTALGENHPHTLLSMTQIANSYNSLGKHFEALEIQKAVFEKQKILLGENHQHTLVNMSNIAISYNGLGKHFDALEMHQEVFEKRKTVLGENHQHTLASMSNIATTYDGLEKYSEALEMHQEVFEKQMTVLGENHPDTLTTMSEIDRIFGKT